MVIITLLIIQRTQLIFSRKFGIYRCRIGFLDGMPHGIGISKINQILKYRHDECRDDSIFFCVTC